MINKLSIGILIIFSQILAYGQEFAEVDTIHSASKELIELTNGEEILLIEAIDFKGDNKKDFIVTTMLDENGYKVREYWISSDYKKIRQADIYKDGIQIRKFINLDNDPEPEVIDATGFEDGIDYTIKNLNLKSGELEVVLYFNPVIESEDQNYWGYPWDWRRLKINNDGQIKTSLNHKIVRDGNVKIPKNQKIMPIIYFEGIPTQESYVEEIYDIDWKKLKEIEIKSR